MFIKYFYDNSLAQASYMVGCSATGTAIVIDPERSIMPYLEMASHMGVSIEHVTETHIHADYVSGSRELAMATGATIYLSAEGGEGWQYEFADDKVKRVKDGDVIMVGNVKLEVMHTPGHTPEHIVFLLTDTAGANKPMGIFTGDFLFVGDVGRPDLLEEAAGFANTAEPGARQQFQNVQRFKELPDYLQIWPGHGAGSACGKALGEIPSTTLGYEKLFNPAFQIASEDKFVKWLLADQPEAPRYFAQMKKVNRIGPELMLQLPQAQHITHSPQQIVPDDALFIDTRPVEIFANKHLPGTVNIPISSDNFATYVGWYVDYDKPTFFISYQNEVQQVLEALFSIGVDDVPAYFTANILDSANGRVKQITPQDAHEKRLTILDVRATSEYKEDHIPGVQHIPMGYVLDRIDEIPRDKPVVVQCGGGVRSQVVMSLLQKRGFTNLLNLTGGIDAWKQDNLPIEAGE